MYFSALKIHSLFSFTKNFSNTNSGPPGIYHYYSSLLIIFYKYFKLIHYGTYKIGYVRQISEKISRYTLVVP